MSVNFYAEQISADRRSSRQRRRDFRMGLGRLAALWLAPLLVAVAGCGESRVAVVPVSGKLTFNGQVPAGAKIVLHAVNVAEQPIAPTATVSADGSFAVTAYDAGDGAPPGEYVATVQWYKIDPAIGGPGPNVIPERYASAKTSPLKVTVNDSPTVLEPIAIADEKPLKRGTAPLRTARR